MQRRAMLLGWLSFGACAGPVHPAADAAAIDAAASDATISDRTAVRVEHGVLRGAEDEGSYAFLGVPFAMPPVGSQRYLPPATVEPWSGERAATSYASPCPQYPEQLANGDPTYIGDEDCLYLNVWTPVDRADSEQLPVIVFLHGGGNFLGSNSDPLDYLVNVTDAGPAYEGPRLSADGRVVVVVPNYRLGALGFLAHTTVGTDATGNFGILDQVAALEWVQRNIEAFGGDRSRVMLVGQSGGAYDVCIHMASSHSAGLFARAMMESGVCYAHPLATMEQYTNNLVTEMNCEGAADVVECLRSVPPEDLVMAEAALPVGLGSFRLHPYVDGDVIPDVPFVVIGSGAYNHVPFVIGTNAHEYANRFETVTDVSYEATLASFLGWPQGSPLLERVLELYPRNVYPSARALVVDVVTDKNLTCTARRISRAMVAAQDEAVFRYQFRRILSTPARLGDGAYHASELLFVFQHMTGEAFSSDADDLLVQNHVLGYWTRFADSGDPNGADAVEWPALDAAESADETPLLAIDSISQVVRGVKTEACDFWDSPVP